MLLNMYNNCYYSRFQEGGQPIHLAAFQGQTEAIELLVDKYGVDPGVRSEVNAKHTPAAYMCSGSIPCLSLCLVCVCAIF